MFHNSANTANPVRTHEFLGATAEYLKFNPVVKAIGDPKLRLFNSETAYNTTEFVTSTGPLKLMEKLTNLPLIKNTSSNAVIKKLIAAKRLN